ncbi:MULTISPECIES: hypothetical protein [unclassified Nocardiopsis]|uniref:hypothetical protein n=1 Tax=Nocardiopsis TaxID=2013 RepID=UPI00387AAD09
MESTDTAAPAAPPHPAQNTPARPAKVFGPRCLVTLLDLEADQRILFAGHDDSLVRSARRRGALPVNALPDPRTGHLPLEDGSVHHVVVATADAAWWAPPLSAEAARVAAPGATLLVGAASRFRFPLRTGAQTPASGRRLLGAAGFGGVRAYGVRHGFHDPRFLVPLDHTGARTWFLTSASMPHRPYQARLAGLLSLLPRTGLDRAYFPNLLFTARRERGPQC